MYNFNTIEILKCTKGMKEVVLRDLRDDYFFLPFCMPYCAKSPHSHA